MYSYSLKMSPKSVSIIFETGCLVEFKMILTSLPNFDENGEGVFTYSDQWGMDKNEIMLTAPKALAILASFSWTRVFPEVESFGTTVRD